MITHFAASLLAVATLGPAEARRLFPDFSPAAMKDLYFKTWVECGLDQTDRLIRVRQPVDASIEHALDHCDYRADHYREALAAYYTDRGFEDPAGTAARQVSDARSSMRGDLAKYLRERRADAAFHDR